MDWVYHEENQKEDEIRNINQSRRVNEIQFLLYHRPKLPGLQSLACS